MASIRVESSILSEHQLGQIREFALETQMSQADVDEMIGSWEEEEQSQQLLRREREMHELYPIAEVARANGLEESAIIEVWLAGALELFVERRASTWSVEVESEVDERRAIPGLAEVDRDDPGARGLLTRDWAYLRCVDWCPRGRTFDLATADVAEMPEHPQRARQIVRRGEMLVTSLDYPGLESPPRWVFRGLKTIGLTAPTTTPVEIAAEVPVRALRRDLRKTLLKMIGVMAQELARLSPKYRNGKDINDTTIADKVKSICLEGTDSDAKDTTRAYKGYLKEAREVVEELRARRKAD